ncbi:MAG TPA: hypothetical protein VH373_24635 [Jatrophihabitantaceae bacterium]|jgi:hypothetical protein
MTDTSTLARTTDDTSAVAIVADGRTIASADVQGRGTSVRVSFSISHGHLPIQVRRRLVDAVFELPEVRGSRAVLATLPLGDVDLLNGLRAHCTAMSTRAAGATCLVDAIMDIRDVDEGAER